MRVLVLSTLLAVSAVILPSPAHAQYFGRNKVEYKDFDFRVITTEHFDVYYYAREQRAAHLAAQLAERWYSRFARVLNHGLDKRQPLVLYGSHAEFAQTNVISGIVSDTIGGVTESARRRIAMPFAPTMAETNRVLGHEIAHAFQFDIAQRHGGGTGLPLWFIEGMAEYLARGATDAEASLWMVDAVRSDRLPKRQRDAASDLSPYQYGHAFWAYLTRRFGDQVLETALKSGKRRKLNDRMRHATGVELDQLYADWRAAAHTVPQGADASSSADTNSATTVGNRNTFGRMQLGPALSPDGRHVVFFSERDRLSLDLFLADLSSGRVIGKLATTAASARFDSLQPLRSSGAWSPNGDHFAFAAVRQGHAALIVLDMHQSGGEREILLQDVGQILSLSWSPDGRAIALSALAGGFTDLYIHDLESGALRQLTDDAAADLHPAWSPHGNAIAFVTERYSSDLSGLRFGTTRLAIVDVKSGSVRAVDAGRVTSHLNPQWAPDGSQLYFVGNADGVRSVLRHDLASTITERLTGVESAVTGITPSSPALSVARNGSVLAFTVYRNARHQLSMMTGPAARVGEPVAENADSTSSGSDEIASDSIVSRLLADDRAGLPDPASLVDRDYSSKLTLEQIGQPYVSSGGGPFGTFVRGGGALLFGDMLGERRLGAALQIGNHLRDLAFEAHYLNQERRWNWGAVVQLEPALRGSRRLQTVDHEGQPALLKQIDYLQRIDVRAAGVVAYPFSRGLRVEFTGGVRRASYQRDTRSQVSSLTTGRVLDRDQTESSPGTPTTAMEVGAALVGDTAVFGPTGPILGSRYRFEIAPVLGQLAYTRVLADYRTYLMPMRPYSLAIRLLHSGRYGGDRNDPRLLPSFLGSRYYVRGHLLSLRHCRPDPEAACGDELRGDRLAVGNVELRFPIWGALRRQIDYGPLPVDAFVFADSGVVWSRGFSATRSFISSIGAGIRVNAAGLLPFEVAAIRALDGPEPRWMFDFGVRVGF